MELAEQITALAQQHLEGTGNYLVEVKVSTAKIIVLIDHLNGVKIDDCARLSRFIQDSLDATDVFEKHELEVGSPGMEEPMKVLQQYHRRIGQKVGVVTFDGLKHTGILKSVSEEGIEIEETLVVKTGKKKATNTRQLSIPFSHIKETRVIFSFDKII